MRDLLRRTKDLGHPGLPLLGVSLVEGVRPRADDDGRPAASLDLSGYKRVREGDIIMNALGKPHGSIGRSSQEGITSPAYWVMEPSTLADSRFLHYLLRSEHMVNEYQRLGKYLPPNQFDISWDDFRAIEVPLPPVEEQRRIADFLDDQVARMDIVIDLRRGQERLLGEVRELSVMSGLLESHAPLVQEGDSPGDRIGLLARHGWTSRPLGSMFRRIKDTGHPSEPMLSVFRDAGVIYKDSRDNLNVTAENRDIYQLVDDGWLVINRMKAWRGSVGVSRLRGIVSGHYICFAPIHEEDHDYLNALFRSPLYTSLWGSLSRGVRPGQAEIDNDWLRSVPVLIPPRGVQMGMVQAAGRELRLADSARLAVAAAIEALEERKRALIIAAVTGELDVTTARPIGMGKWVPNVGANAEAAAGTRTLSSVGGMG